MKTCPDCKETLDVKKFYKGYVTVEGVQSYAKRCKVCTRAYILKRARENGKHKLAEKECTKCKEVKTIDNFHFGKTTGYYSSHCIPCKNIQGKLRYRGDKKEEYYARMQKYNLEKYGGKDRKEKHCPRCDETKSTTEFYFNKNTQGYQSYCKQCVASHRLEKYSGTDYDKKYYEDNKEQILEYTKNWQAENKDKISDQRKEYLADHPEVVLACRLVKNAIASGELVRPDNCECCDKLNDFIDFHHMDYDKPLQGLWVCRSKHIIYHNGNQPKVIELFEKLWKEKYPND